MKYEVRSDRAATVIWIRPDDGYRAVPAETLVVVEMMKMEEVFEAPAGGDVEIHVTVGQFVQDGDLLATIKQEENNAENSDGQV